MTVLGGRKVDTDAFAVRNLLAFNFPEYRLPNLDTDLVGNMRYSSKLDLNR